MDEIRELLQNLQQLTAEDLERLRGLITSEFDTLDKEPATPEVVAAQNELADAGEQVQAEAGAREAAQAQAEADRENARQRIAKANGTTEEDETEVEAPEASTEDPEAEVTETVEEPAEAVAASGRKPGKIASMARRQGVAKPSPETPSEDHPATTALVASGLGYGARAGESLDKDKLAEVMARSLSAMPKPQGPPGSSGQRVLIASADWTNQYPPERRATGEFEHDARMLRETSSRDALVATGGICAPVNVDWSIGMIATADRPVQAALPANQVSRGGLIYRPDLDFAGLTNAIGIWTEATDLNPAGATKPILQVACPPTSTVFVEAVTSRLGFGNMQSRFDPETVAANTDAALAAYARVADNNLLNQIAAACTQGVTNTHALGATRDLLTLLGEIMAGYRNLHRIPRSQAVRALFPDWMKELLRIDLARETAHQQDSSWNSLAITDAQIESLFEPYGVTPIWHLDGQSSGTQGVANNQFFTTQSTGAVNTFPATVTWYLWYEGAFQYLDGGRLDLGIVRDSLLDATNDYEVFVEVFENVAYRGFTGGALQLNTTLCASGGSAGTQNTQASTSTSCP